MAAIPRTCPTALSDRNTIGASGVPESPAPAGRKQDSRCMSDGEIDAGGPGGSEPQRRLSGGGADTAKGRSVERGDGGLRGSAGTKTGTSAGGRTPAGSEARHRCGGRSAGEARACGREPDRERGAKRARGRRCRRNTVGRKRNGPHRRRLARTTIRGSDDAAREALRFRQRGKPGCRAASPCRRRSR